MTARWWLVFAATLCILPVAAGVGAGRAVADAPNILDYAATHGSELCTYLDEHPDDDGVTTVVLAIMADGFGDAAAGEVLGLIVMYECPDNFGVLQAFVDRMETPGQVSR